MNPSPDCVIQQEQRRAAAEYARISVFTVEAMRSRPMRMPAAYSSRAEIAGSRRWISRRGTG